MTKKIVIIIAVLLLFVTIFTSQFTISFAANENELKNKKNEINNNINEAKDKQNEIKDNIKQTKTELEILNDEIAEKEYEVDQITAELNSLNAEVSKLENELKDATERYDTKYDILCKRLAAQYKTGKTSYLDVLLNSKSLTDFISKYYIIGKIAEYDTELLEDIEEEKQNITTSKQEVEKKQGEVAEKQKQLKLEEITLTNKRNNKSKYVSQLSSEEQALQKEIDNFNKQLKEIDYELLQIALSANGGGAYSGGQFVWPVQGGASRISSGFGYRGSAATGGVGTSNHNGYDIASAHGLSIVAAESGRVIKVVRGCVHDYPKTFATRCYCGGGYGNYLMIDHGGITTLYGHCASISANVGDVVVKGQEVGKVGSCGWSTGNHVHFSVIKGGTYVNPGTYLGR